MPKGPKGEKRPADVIGAAVKVMQIATGEIEETTSYCRKLVTECSGGVLNLLDAVLEPHSLDDFGEMI